MDKIIVHGESLETMSRNYKTDVEIKKWIDSQKAVTQGELARYAGYKSRQTTRVYYWWEYVLRTKDFNAIEERKRENNLHIDDRRRLFIKLYNSDKRLREFGSLRITRILKEVYRLIIPRTTLRRYLHALEK